MEEAMVEKDQVDNFKVGKPGCKKSRFCPRKRKYKRKRELKRKRWMAIETKYSNLDAIIGKKIGVQVEISKGIMH